MNPYNLWFPSYIRSAPMTLDCFITLGSSMFLGRGTNVFVNAALAPLGIQAQPGAWRLTPMRTHYFTSYRDSDNWRDRWELTWRLRVRLDPKKSPALPTLPDGHVGSMALDESFVVSARPDLWNKWPLILLFETTTLEPHAALRALLARRFPDAQFDTGHAYGTLIQLRCQIPARAKSYFELGAEGAEKALGEAEQRGASCHYSISRDLALARH